MPVHALDAIDDAVGPTRALLRRIGVGGWLKLGGVGLLVGGFGSVSFSAHVPRAVLRVLPALLSGGHGPAAGIGFVLGLALLGLALALFLLVRSLLEFVLYESMRQETVAVRRSLRTWWRAALQLWAFRVVVVWSLLAVGLVVAAAIVNGDVAVGGVASDALLSASVLATFGGYAFVGGLTTRFVVPVMMASGAGIAGAWVRFLRAVADTPGQYLWYLLVGLFVRFAADVLALSAALLVAVLLAVPLGAVVVPTAMLANVAPSAATTLPFAVLVAVLGTVYVVLALLGAVLARLPFVVYVRHYALAVLRGTAPSLDPLD